VTNDYEGGGKLEELLERLVAQGVENGKRLDEILQRLEPAGG
jgi:hypothetical protein